jgi:hypothetical protein
MYCFELYNVFTNTEKARGVAQVKACLPRKWEALSSTSQTDKRKRKKRKEKKRKKLAKHNYYFE